MSGACSTHQVDEKCRKVLVVKPEGNRPPPRPEPRWEDNIKMDGWHSGSALDSNLRYVRFESRLGHRLS
jgi:hypothetical protein